MRPSVDECLILQQKLAVGSSVAKGEQRRTATGDSWGGVTHGRTELHLFNSIWGVVGVTLERATLGDITLATPLAVGELTGYPDSQASCNNIKL